MTTHAQVAGNWIKQSGKATNGFRMFYRDSQLFSHGTHYLAARVFPGCRLALVNSERYSQSTAMHCNHAVKAALRNGYEVIHVPFPYAGDSGEHFANVEYLKAKVKQEVERANRARVHKNLDYAKRIKTDLDTYCNAFNLPTAETPPLAA